MYEYMYECMYEYMYVYIYTHMNIWLYMYKLGTAKKKKKNGRYRLFLLGVNPIPLEYIPPL